MKKFFSVIIIVCCFSLSCTDQVNFKSVQIGEQVWMAENLSVTRFRNGDEIPEAKSRVDWMRACSTGQPIWSNPVNSRENSEKYGKLYNWYAVNDPRGIAPGGWHVPTDDDWKHLTDFLGGEIFAAYKLRTTADGSEQTSETGFSGLPAGGCKSDGTYFGFGSSGYWWTSTEVNNEFAWIRQLDYVRGSINSLSFDKQSGLSVRCIKTMP